MDIIKAIAWYQLFVNMMNTRQFDAAKALTLLAGQEIFTVQHIESVDDLTDMHLWTTDQSELCADVEKAETDVRSVVRDGFQKLFFSINKPEVKQLLLDLRELVGDIDGEDEDIWIQIAKVKAMTQDPEGPAQVTLHVSSLKLLMELLADADGQHLVHVQSDTEVFSE
jgi:hypothetical protein